MAQEFNAILRRFNELETRLNVVPTEAASHGTETNDNAPSQDSPQPCEPRTVSTAEADAALELLDQI